MIMAPGQIMVALTTKDVNRVSFKLKDLRPIDTPCKGVFAKAYGKNISAGFPHRDYRTGTGEQAEVKPKTNAGQLANAFDKCHGEVVATDSGLDGLVLEDFTLAKVSTELFELLIASTEKQLFLEDLVFLAENWTEMKYVAAADFCAWGQSDCTELRQGEENGQKWRNVIQNIESTAKVNLDLDGKADKLKVNSSFVAKLFKKKEFAAEVTWVKDWTQAKYDAAFAKYNAKISAGESADPVEDYDSSVDTFVSLVKTRYAAEVVDKPNAADLKKIVA